MNPSLRLASVRHDLVALEVFDRFEEELPPLGLLEVRDLELGTIATVDTSNADVRARYIEVQRARRAATAARFARLGVDHLRIRTDEDPVGPLVSFFKARQQRARRVGR